MDEDINNVIQEAAQEAVQEQAEQIAGEIKEAAQDVLTLNDIKSGIDSLFAEITSVRDLVFRIAEKVDAIEINSYQVNNAIEVAAAAVDNAETQAEIIEEVIEEVADETGETPEQIVSDAIDNLPAAETIETPALDIPAPEEKAIKKRKIFMI